jgi:hypothetical protein
VFTSLEGQPLRRTKFRPLFRAAMWNCDTDRQGSGFKKYGGICADGSMRRLVIRNAVDDISAVS